MLTIFWLIFFFFSSRRRHTRLQGDWSSDVCSSDLESENDPLETGLARVPDSPAVAVTVPPTPAVSRSSSAYSPTSGNPSSWRGASARPRVGRAPSRTSLPDPYAPWSTSPVTVTAESVTVSSVGRSSTHTSPGSWTASESTPTASAALPVWAARRGDRPPGGDRGPP